MRKSSEDNAELFALGNALIDFLRGTDLIRFFGAFKRSDLLDVLIRSARSGGFILKRSLHFNLVIVRSRYDHVIRVAYCKPINMVILATMFRKEI